VANHKSAKKRAKQTIVRTERNKSKRSEVRSAVKAVRMALADKDGELAKKKLLEAQSLLSKTVKSGVYKAKTAARYTSRLAQQVTKL
jgi:small subunit ribosomal protein S20